MIVELKEGDKCSFEECDSNATEIACGRGESGHEQPAVYCDAHGNMVADENDPEYIDSCPNCGCSFGIN